MRFITLLRWRVGSEYFIQIEALESSALRALSGIKSLQNAYSPVNRLHPEMLEIIFSFCAYEWHHNSNSHRHTHSYGSPELYHWISITHVCRYWRSTALCFSPIWGCVDFGCPAMAHQCLERSRSSAIDVVIRAESKDSVFESVRSHMWRIEELSILRTPDTLRSLSHLDNVAAPKLTRFSASIVPGLHDLYPEFPIQFHANAPSLRSLLLTRFSAWNAISRISSLVHLHLEDEDAMNAPSMTLFLDIMEANLKLQSVSLLYAGPHDDDALKSRIVRLDCLDEFRMTKCAVRMILSHLLLPATSNVIVHQIEVIGLKGIVEETLPASLDNLPNTEEFRVVGFKRCHPLGFSLFGRRNPPGGSVALSSASFEEHDVHVLANCLRNFGPLSFAHATELWLDSLPLMNQEQGVLTECFSAMFSFLPAVEQLTVIHCGMSVLEALQPTDTSTPCSHLTTLTIHNWGSVFPTLLDVARARKSRGFAFKKVITGPLWELSDQLKEVVEVVEYRSEGDAPEWPFKRNESYPGPLH